MLRRLAQLEALDVVQGELLHIVRRYKHLGSIITADLAAGPDLRHRRLCASQALGAFRQYVAGKA
eukprot:444947-Lingulodinium_polyedra.AAC.1